MPSYVSMDVAAKIFGLNGVAYVSATLAPLEDEFFGTDELRQLLGTV